MRSLGLTVISTVLPVELIFLNGYLSKWVIIPGVIIPGDNCRRGWLSWSYVQIGRSLSEGHLPVLTVESHNKER